VSSPQKRANTLLRTFRVQPTSVFISESIGSDMQTNQKLAYEADSSQMFQEILESSKALREALASLSNAATTNCNILIIGETGTGKELVARVIHRWSHRSPRAFVRVNCAAIQPQLIASELFGQRKGSHPPQTQPRLDGFPLAEGGTIFLQGIDDLVPEAQSVLLGVLEDMEPLSTGRNRSPRLIASTRHDLQAATNAGTFLRGLFDRLNEVSITLPPLRDQTEDIPALARYFLNRYFLTCRSTRQEKRPPDLSESAMNLLKSYPWPGNMHELQNVMERFAILSEPRIFYADATWIPWESVLTQIPAAPGPGMLIPNEMEILDAALIEMLSVLPGWEAWTWWDEPRWDAWMEKAPEQIERERLKKLSSKVVPIDISRGAGYKETLF
jgi:formate hydrogenlyase transcriptional activator